jgi:hypothetical protein
MEEDTPLIKRGGQNLFHFCGVGNDHELAPSSNTIHRGGEIRRIDCGLLRDAEIAPDFFCRIASRQQEYGLKGLSGQDRLKPIDFVLFTHSPDMLN